MKTIERKTIKTRIKKVGASREKGIEIIERELPVPHAPPTPAPHLPPAKKRKFL